MKRPSYQTYYHELLEEILRNGTHEVNRRTGRGIRSLHGGFSFACDLSTGVLPVTGTRRLFPKSAFAEVAWFLSGSMDVSWLTRHAPMWDKFVEPGTSIVRNAYGYRWRDRFGRDQLGMALAQLQRDPSDRQCVVMAWDPGEDGLGDDRSSPRNVPCPLGFAVNAVGGAVHMSVFIRSSDVFVGLPYDVMGHALLLDAMAATLGRRPGVLHVTLAHAHLYDAHEDMAMECVNAWSDRRERVTGVLLPRWSVGGIESSPDDYVALGKRLADGDEWPVFNPKPELVL